MDFRSKLSHASAIVDARWFFPTLLAACIVAYAAMLALNVGAYAGDSDSSGYMNNARLLAAGKVSELQRSLPDLPPGKVGPFTYVPLGFRPVHPPEMVPTYPTGIPLMLAAASKVFGWDAGAFLTIALHALAGVVLTYLLGRTFGLARGWALVGAVMLGLGPLYLFWSFQMMTDMPALVWTTGAILLAWNARKRPGIVLPLLAGAAFGMAVLVRPTNFLAIIPLAVALGVDWRRWITFSVGGVPSAAFLALFNKAAYGNALESGYQGIADIVKLAYAGPTLWHYARWIPVLVSPLIVLSLIYPFLGSVARRERLLLMTWVVAFAGFYACYLFTRESWWYLRFVLPIFPPAIVAALLVVQSSLRKLKLPAVRGAVAAVTAAFAITWLLSWSESDHVWNTKAGTIVYPRSAEWARDNLPDDAVVLAMQTSGSLIFYTDLSVVRYDVLSPADITKVNASLERLNRPLYAVLFPYEEEEVTEKRFPGQWTKLGNVRHVSIWRRDSAEPAPQH